MKMYLLPLVAAAGLAMATSAQAATTFNALTDFNGSNPNTPWSYGYGDPATAAFVPLTIEGSSFGGITGLEYLEGVPNASNVPVIIRNLTGSPVNIGSPYVPTDALLVHPGPDSLDPASDIIVQFTAPTTSSYTYLGFFELLDNSPTGVTGQVFEGTSSLYSQALSSPGANSTAFTPGASESFGGPVFLTAGQTLSFAVANNGNYSNDSTGFFATITAVPEPATWSMLLLGFGAIGWTLRGKRREEKVSGAVA